nr:serine protease 53-like [Labrus bergylta]
MHALQKLLLFCVLAGFRGNALGSEIINGKKAKEKSMLYMASVQSKAGHICGGFLISEDFVVTAAHCDKWKPTSVVLGTHHLNKLNETMRYSVKKCKHPSYKEVGSGNDIMLLKLSVKAPLGKKGLIKPIKLPSHKMKLKDNKKCQVVGWGMTSTKGEVENDLREVEVPVINLEKCQKLWKNKLPSNVICAGGYGTKKGFCQGDSGGPLVCDKQAVGVVSFNNNDVCDYPDVPNVYTDVSKYLPWIKEILKKKNSLGSEIIHGKKAPDNQMLYMASLQNDSETMALIFIQLLLFILSGADGSKIVGGQDAAPHSRPYMASLQVRGQHFCGGVLVKEDFVLTAAHCLINRPFTVVVGVDSLSRAESTKQEFRVARSFPHPNYDGHENDIMLLKLGGSAALTEAVQLIPPKIGRPRECITAGWGDIGDNNTIATRLQEVNVTLLSQRICQRRWGAVPITSSMLCGTGARVFQGFCSGDSGGPLVCDGDAAGVVSFSGQRCGDPKTPDVYTRVASFRRWIRNVLKNN